jgi:hypothetical protein
MGLINHLAKSCFVQGLSNERIQTIVTAKGETALLSVCIDAAMEENLQYCLLRREDSPPPEVEQEMHLEDLVEGLGSQPWKEIEDLEHPGHGVGFGTNGSTARRAHVVAEDVAREHVIMKNHEKIWCHACGALGHISRNCRKRGTAMWRDNKVIGNRERGQGSSLSGNLPE